MANPYVNLSPNIDFSDFRKIDETYDEFDIIVDGKIVHTMRIDCSGIMGSSSEEFVYAKAYSDAKQWLVKNRHLPCPHCAQQ